MKTRKFWQKSVCAVLSCTLFASAVFLSEARTTDGSAMSGTGICYDNYTKENIPEALQSGMENLSAAEEVSWDIAEDLSAVILDYGNGEKSVYQYESNIKYLDADNSVRFIDNELVPSTEHLSLFRKYRYENKANDVKTYFPKTLSDALAVRYEDHQLKLKPIKESDTVYSQATLIDGET